MTTSYIPQESSGGGGGSGTVTSVNVSGGTTGLSFAGGPITTAGTMTMGGVVNIAHGGTGQSNQQAGLNNLTNVSAGTNLDVLTLSGGNAQWLPSPGVTYAQINAALALPNNVFLFSNAAAEVVGYGEWSISDTTRFSNVQILYQPNNLSQFPQAFNWNVAVDPLQNSPNDGLQIQSFNANLDSAATGFNLGTNGDAAQLMTGGYTYNGNGATYGRLRYLNLYSGLGNGTDPFTFKGITTSALSANVNANTTIDGSCNGYDFNLNINAASLSTSNFSVSVFSDSSQIPINLYGYQGVVIQPNIATIKNNSNFTGFNLNPTIGSLEGNASFTGVAVGGVITNQSASAGFQGVSVNPNIVHLTQSSTGINIGGQTTDGTADWTCLNISTGQINTTGSVKGLQITTANDGSQYAINASGHCDLNTPVRLQSGLTQQYGHVIGGEIQFDDGVTPAVTTGTDVLANNMAFTVNTGLAGSTWTQASPVGLTTLGFVGQISGDGDVIGAINFCLNGYNPIVNGTIDRVNNFAALVIPNSGTGTITESVLFFGDGPFGAASPNTWGLRIDDTTSAGIENFVTRLAVNTTTKKVTNASVALEIGGTTSALLLGRLTTAEKTALTAINGMMCYDTDLDKFQGYEAGSWTNLI